MVLDTALALATCALVASAVMLVLLGRVPSSGRRFRLLALGIAPALALVGNAVGSLEVGLATGLAVALLAQVLPRYWHTAGAVFFAAIVVTLVLYAVYLVRVTMLLGGDPIAVALGALLLLLQMGAMLLLVTGAFELVDGVGAEAPVLAVAPDVVMWPVVCVQVPTYNEPPDLVIETIRSLAALDYPALRIQVIDNNTSDERLWRPVEAECARLRAEGHRCDFAHLPEWPGYKGGALNWGLRHLTADVEIVGVIDADYVVDQDWLKATVPHFGDRAVAFVQTPQDYRAWEKSAFYRACYVGFSLFFSIAMVSRSRRNSIIFAGTMGLIRRSTLEEIGGWDERIITEDAEASLRVLAQGYRSVYVPQAFGRGLMPLTYEGLRKQRFRWAFGGIQILRKHWRLLLPWNRRSQLTLGQRYDHAMGGLWWFNDALTFGFTVFVAAAALGAIAGRPIVIQRLTGIGFVLPLALIAVNLGRYVWALRAATRVSVPLALAALRINLSLSWVIAIACARGLTQERGVFLRTPKFEGAPAIRELRVVWVEAVLALTSMLLLGGVLARAGFEAVGLGLAGLLAWSMLIYGSAVGYALADPTRAPLTEALRQKALLEIGPRVGRVVRAPAGRAALAGAFGVLLFALAMVTESGRAPIGELPFAQAPRGPLAPQIVAVRPGDSPVPGSTEVPTASVTSLPTGTRPQTFPPGGASRPSASVNGLGTPTPISSPGPSSGGPAPTPPPTFGPGPTSIPTGPPQRTAVPTAPIPTSLPIPSPGAAATKPPVASPPILAPTPPAVSTFGPHSGASPLAALTLTGGPRAGSRAPMETTALLTICLVILLAAAAAAARPASRSRISRR